MTPRGAPCPLDEIPAKRGDTAVEKRTTVQGGRNANARCQQSRGNHKRPDQRVPYLLPCTRLAQPLEESLVHHRGKRNPAEGRSEGLGRLDLRLKLEGLSNRRLLGK
jgi:hypothetical protein